MCKNVVCRPDTNFSYAYKLRIINFEIYFCTCKEDKILRYSLITNNYFASLNSFFLSCYIFSLFSSFCLEIPLYYISAFANLVNRWVGQILLDLILQDKKSGFFLEGVGGGGGHITLTN